MKRLFWFAKKQEQTAKQDKTTLPVGEDIWIQEMVDYPVDVWRVLGASPRFRYVKSLEEINNQKALYTIPSQEYHRFKRDLMEWDFTKGNKLRELLIALSRKLVQVEREVESLKRSLAKQKGETEA